MLSRPAVKHHVGPERQASAGIRHSSKSRRYSTTLTALRQARAEHRAEEQRTALGIGTRQTVTVGQWRYAGRGYSPEAALLAASAREGGASHGA